MEVKETNETMLRDVIKGLSRSQKTLPSKYFYDERGSKLFEKICKLDEYYLTRTEVQIIENNIDEICSAMGTGINLIELGSGSSYKTRLLLDHLSKVRTYIPVDISERFLLSAAEQIACEYPELQVQPIVTDYTRPFSLPDSNIPNVIFFPGSTIGNFTPKRARKFLAMISKLTEENGGLLIGADLKKDRKILEAAYNDSRGVTAAFNKNILRRLNEVLNAGFDLDSFKHRAIFDEEKGRIEMHLVSLRQQQVQVNGTEFSFKKGESIHTENSYKYSLQEFKELAELYFRVEKVWIDRDELFSIWYLESG